MSVKAIKVDTDKACSKCGEMGACGNGLCMQCSADRFLGQPISEAVLQGLINIREELVGATQQLREAYLKEDVLSISMSIKVSPAREQNNYNVEHSVTFTLEKFTRKGKTKVSPNQWKLDI